MLEFVFFTLDAAYNAAVPFVFIGPEYLVTHNNMNPCNPYDFEEATNLMNRNSVFTGAFYGCQLAATTTKRPLRMISTIAPLRTWIHVGLPELRNIAGRLVYHGPLPKQCGCPHHDDGHVEQPFDDFCVDLLLTPIFGKRLLRCTLDYLKVALRDGGIDEKPSAPPLVTNDAPFLDPVPKPPPALHDNSRWWSWTASSAASPPKRHQWWSWRAPSGTQGSAEVVVDSTKLSDAVKSVGDPELYLLRKAAATARRSEDPSNDHTHVERNREQVPRREEDRLAPRRCALEDVSVMKKGDLYIGRGSRQLGLQPSPWGNPFKVRDHGLARAVDLYRQHVRDTPFFRRKVDDLEGKRLLCHCRPGAACHADVLIEFYLSVYPRAYVVGLTEEPPSQLVALKAAEGREDVDKDSDTEPDQDAAPWGAGWIGHGDPLFVGRVGKHRPLNDGAGLCSPGRWRIKDRRFPTSTAWRSIQELVWGAALTWGTSDLYSSLKAGQIACTPFAEEKLDKLRCAIAQRLKKAGYSHSRERGDLTVATPRWRLMAGMLAAGEDPDTGIAEFAKGVPVGVNVRMPRLPAIYHRKVKWRLPTQKDPDVVNHPVPQEQIWMANYKSIDSVLPSVRKALDEEVQSGRMIRLTRKEANARFGPELRVAALGAQVKNYDEQGEPVVRVLHDGTHGVQVNGLIRVRDQDAGPLAPDIKRVLRAQAMEETKFDGLIVDVKGAHRLVPIREKDWKYQACALEGDDHVYVNTVGTFGIASASYWWSRAAGALCRLAHYTITDKVPFWLMLVSDDMWISAAGRWAIPALTVPLVLAAVLDFPLSWRKVKGGQKLSWVGYEILLKEHALGITASRAAWAVRWCSDLLQKGVVDPDVMREGVGRLTFVAGALDWDRAFMAPLYAFITVAQLDGKIGPRALPPYVKLALAYLSESLPLRRHLPCRPRGRVTSAALRVDAHASPEGVGIGAWLPNVHPDGSLDTQSSRWLAFSVTPDNAPWAFGTEGESFRRIAALEALAVLIAIKHLLPQEPYDQVQQTVQLTEVLTDNRGNGHILTKLHTTKFPVSAIVMELAFLLKQRNLQAEVVWVPRETNVQADALSNLDWSKFAADNRVHVDLATEKWHFLDRALVMGEVFFAEARNPIGRTADHKVHRKKRKEDRLKVKDPW